MGSNLVRSVSRPRTFVLLGLVLVFLAQIVGLVQAVVFQEKYLRRPSPPADVLLYARYLAALLGFIPTGCWVVGLWKRGVSVIH